MVGLYNYSDTYTNIIFEGNSTVSFDDNEVTYNGGVVHSVFSVVVFKENCEVTFHNNIANNNGGTMYIDAQYDIKFEENSTITFDVNETANSGGAIYNVFSRIIFNGNCEVVFEENEAKVMVGLCMLLILI